MGFIYSRLKIKLSILHCVFDIKHGQIIYFVLDWIQNIFETKNEVLYFKLFSPLFPPTIYIIYIYEVSQKRIPIVRTIHWIPRMQSNYNKIYIISF